MFGGKKMSKTVLHLYIDIELVAAAKAKYGDRGLSKAFSNFIQTDIKLNKIKEEDLNVKKTILEAELSKINSMQEMKAQQEEEEQAQAFAKLSFEEFKKDFENIQTDYYEKFLNTSNNFSKKHFVGRKNYLLSKYGLSISDFISYCDKKLSLEQLWSFK